MWCSSKATTSRGRGCAVTRVEFVKQAQERGTRASACPGRASRAGLQTAVVSTSDLALGMQSIEWRTRRWHSRARPRPTPHAGLPEGGFRKRSSGSRTLIDPADRNVALEARIEDAPRRAEAAARAADPAHRRTPRVVPPAPASRVSATATAMASSGGLRVGVPWSLQPNPSRGTGDSHAARLLDDRGPPPRRSRRPRSRGPDRRHARVLRRLGGKARPDL